MKVIADKISWNIGKKPILSNISFAVESGETVGLIGPNGSGKSSLLRILAGLQKPHEGQVQLGTHDISALARRDIARNVALVHQHAATDLQIGVNEVVCLGRTPYRGAFSPWTKRDEAAVDAALERTGVARFRDRKWQTLSGGEQQRVQIAKALAQEPKILFLDEPTNHLDIAHQLQILKLVRTLDMTSIIALHDLNHAAMFCDRIIVLKEGQVVANGTPHAVINEAMLRDVFEVASIVASSDEHTPPQIRFIAE